MTEDSDIPDRSPLRFLPDERPPLTLTPADAAALDALLDPEASASAQIPQDGAARQARAQQWLAVLGAYRVAQPPADLIERTLAAVEADQASLAAARQEQEARLRGRGMRIGQQFGEFAAMAIAATLLIAVLIPGLGAARQGAKRVACAANMGIMGNAFQLYSADSSAELPSLAQSPDGNWMPHDVSLVQAGQVKGHSNTANLLPLVRQNRVGKGNLICPARETVSADFNPNLDEIPDTVRGYSYINLFTSKNGPRIHYRWDGSAATIILADRNPLFSAPCCNDPRANSFNHGQHGTNILAADGSVLWITNPNVGPHNDNIWTLNDEIHPAYTGVEVSNSPWDIFMVP